MEIVIKTNKIKLTNELRSLFEKRIKILERFVGEKILETTIEIKKISKHQKGPFFSIAYQVRLPGITLRVEALKENLKFAILAAEKKLERKLKELKEKRVTKFKKGARKAKKALLISELAKEKERIY